jgi:radical SAM superfamily enzyme YgiQ (UPF0313 family)
MPPSVYLVNPVSALPTYFSSEVYAASGFQPAAGMADLAIASVAALLPDDFHVQLTDENISPVDFDTGADFVGITGKINQWPRMEAIAEEFRRRGKVVLIGGPYASLCPEVARPHCDILVRGETEDLFGALAADLRAGTWKDEYVGSKPDLASAPLPRWDLYPNERALIGTIQTSRGCPFECEFCDVIQYLGRKQRHKPITQVLRELDRLYRHGYRTIFIADDNLTVYRARARELLEALRDWNVRQERGKVRFFTQVSIDAARDEGLLRLASEAGLTTVFIGIETTNEDSLKETKKRQNVGIDLAEQVGRFLANGIAVVGGMIVGFDADGPDIFARQYEFAMQTGVPIFTVGALVAPAATPLYARMEREGRLLAGGPEMAGSLGSTNIVPRQMSGEQLREGLRWLCSRLYEPAAFGERIERLLDGLGPRRDPGRGEARRAPERGRAVERDSVGVLARLPRLGEAEAKMWSRVLAKLGERPDAAETVMLMLLVYMQIRHMYSEGTCWEAHVGPDAAAASAGA